MATTASGWPYAEPNDTLVSWPTTSETLADKLETDITAIKYLPQNAQTGTTYTFVLADAEKLVTASNAGSQTYTIPPQSSVAWPANTILNVSNLGAGTVTFAGGAGVTLTNSTQTLAQYQSASLVRTGADAWVLLPFAGGVTPLSDSAVTGTTGSPSTGTYSSGGINYKYYSFTGSGSITVSKGGLIDLLLVGGGGAGGSSTANLCGGGGAGGHLSVTDYFINTGTHTVTVGGGASVGTIKGSDSRFVSLYAIGGGSNLATNDPGRNGGSGGGGNNNSGGGAGIVGQGNSGGNNQLNGSGAGGGGAGAQGGAATLSTGGNGGAGTANSITGTSVTRAGGGGGGGRNGGAGGTGGSGGGGNGGAVSTNSGISAGTANTGGGGGGSGDGASSGGRAGGSGIVIIRVRA